MSGYPFFHPFYGMNGYKIVLLKAIFMLYRLPECERVCSGICILLKTIEGLNASIASLSTTNKNQSEQIKNLQERIKELTAQVAWLNRQLFVVRSA